MSEEEYFSEEEYVDDEDDDAEDVDEDDLGAVDDQALQETLTKQRSFEVISEDDMLKESRLLIDGVMEFLGIPNRAIAACLLRSYDWNRERLIEAYTEDPERVCKKAGVPSLNLEKPIESPNAIVRPPPQTSSKQLYHTCVFSEFDSLCEGCFLAAVLFFFLGFIVYFI